MLHYPGQKQFKLHILPDCGSLHCRSPDHFAKKKICMCQRNAGLYTPTQFFLGQMSCKSTRCTTFRLPLRRARDTATQRYAEVKKTLRRLLGRPTRTFDHLAKPMPRRRRNVVKLRWMCMHESRTCKDLWNLRGSISLWVPERSHSMPENLIPAKKMVPIPRLNEDEPKYSGGYKLRIAQMRKYYTTRFAGGQFFSESPRALIPCLRNVFRSKNCTHSTSERQRAKIFQEFKLRTAQMRKYLLYNSVHRRLIFFSVPSMATRTGQLSFWLPDA